MPRNVSNLHTHADIFHSLSFSATYIQLAAYLAIVVFDRLQSHMSATLILW
jgi:hypothetical protein